ncbi:acetyl-CoA carboxylase biotin carboxyl carrier protein [Latilactobacillus sakei]|uniref:acetyl-CoA carboxylase biotin carboxyl carrier protein n=1 Tax=Latilactobacillus sakei TaxID=1599 RepID=UPI00202F8F64|nr:acetyl-CoA carboxylase biotin carboxyl carrier protein subunit [Latilactobacillus sakei]MCM1635773.1 acetyl-CoA carboxylase biotin carboxyl carrier protein subunit [Latilactobacillus sakei]
MNSKEIEGVVNTFKDSGISKLIYTDDTCKLVLENHQDSEKKIKPNNQEKIASNGDESTIKSKMVGLIHFDNNKVKVGQTFKKGDTIATIEVMKMETELKSPHDGKLVEIFAQPESIVEAEQPLFSMIYAKEDKS